jgi:Conserved hypothetical protein (DUF2461)
MFMQGYEADNPNIELLRLKNFTIGTKLKDEEVIGPGCLDRIAGLVGTMSPFVSPRSCCCLSICQIVARTGRYGRQTYRLDLVKLSFIWVAHWHQHGKTNLSGDPPVELSQADKSPVSSWLSS